jgi:hypothetical protein
MEYRLFDPKSEWFLYAVSRCGDEDFKSEYAPFLYDAADIPNTASKMSRDDLFAQFSLSVLYAIIA